VARWLPTGFTVIVAWPEESLRDWRTALERAAVIAGRLLPANPTMTVRQCTTRRGEEGCAVDPDCARTVASAAVRLSRSLCLRWCLAVAPPAVGEVIALLLA